MSILAGSYADTILNTDEIPQRDLNIESKHRSNPLNWNGQFSPQLVEVLLNKYASRETVIFDPFLGSGTVLFEAGQSNLTAYGTEINPAAISLSQTYRFINVAIEKRRLIIQKIDDLIKSKFSESTWFFDNSKSHLEDKALKFGLLDLLIIPDDRLEYQILETLITLLDYYQDSLSLHKVFSIWHKLKAHIINLPYSTNIIDIFHADARKTPLQDKTIDLVITSPPYINVFNYHQQYRASMESLNWDLLTVAKSEFGSNRKHRGNRFFTVTQFCLDIAQTFQELFRICRHNGRLIFVVGRESTIRGTRFFNGELVTEVACRALNYNLLLRQERVFVNRFGKKIVEDILHFSPPQFPPSENFLQITKSVARDVLNSTYDSISTDVIKADIRSALENLEKIKPSPLFDLSQACKALTIKEI